MNITSLQSLISTLQSSHSDTLSLLLNTHFNIHTKLLISDFPDIEQQSHDKPDHIRNYDNKQNFYLRTLDILEAYMKQTTKSLLEFFYEYMKSGCLDVQGTGWTERAQKKRIGKVNRWLARMELWARDSREIRIVLGLFLTGRRDWVEVYLKLRRKILELTAEDNIVKKNQTVSTHNMAKYSKPLVQTLQKIDVDVYHWVGLTEYIISVFAKNLKVQKAVEFIHQSALYFQKPTILGKMKAVTFMMISFYMINQSKGISSHQQIVNNPQSPYKKNRLNKTSMMMFTHYANQQQEIPKLSNLSELKILSRSMDMEQPYKLTEKTKYDYMYKLNTSRQITYGNVEESKINSSPMSKFMKSHKKQDLTVSRIRRQMSALSTSLRNEFKLSTTRQTQGYWQFQ